MARRKSKLCACCSYVSAEPHHGGFNVCSMCRPEAEEKIAEGPVRDGNYARDARYRLVTWRCGSALCKGKILGTHAFVIEWKQPRT